MIVATVPSARVPGAVDALRASLTASGNGPLLVGRVGAAWPAGSSDLDLADAVGPDVLARLRLAADPDHLDVLLGPAVLLAALQQVQQPVAFLRATSVVLAALAPLADAVTHPSGLAVLGRTGDLPPADGRWPGPLDVEALGPVDGGVLVASPAAVPVLEAWVAALAAGVLEAPLAAAALAGRAAVLPPSLAVAWWNLHDRASSLDGALLARLDDADPDHPELLRSGPPSPRHLLSADPALADLVRGWSAAVGASDEVVGTAVAPGLDPPEWFRRRYLAAWRTAVDGGRPLPPAPAGEAGLRSLVAWLEVPDPLGTAPLPRWQEWVWQERADVRATFGEVSSGDLARFSTWLGRSGAAELAVPVVVRLPDPEPPPAAPVQAGSGVDVIGYFGAVLGNATSAERVLDALRAAGEPATPVVTRRSWSDRSAADDGPSAGPSAHDVAVAVVTPHQFSSLRGDLGPAYTSSRHLVGYWFWETEVLAPSLVPAAELVDEIWVATEFGRLAFEGLGKPVHVLPHPITPPQVEGPVTLESFGLPERFTFLFAFDAFSNVERKNPLGVVEAYTRAFGPDDGTQLVVKTLNGVRRAADLEPLRLAARGRPDIHLLDGTWTTGRTAALMAAAGCYVSLHRAEGFGMTMAEALWLGTPVVATGYSGNLDFLGPESAFLVPHELVPVPEGCDPYPAGTPWAEPDVGAAAALLRQVYEEPELAGYRTARGREHLASAYSPMVCGRRMRERLREIRRTR